VFFIAKIVAAEPSPSAVAAGANDARLKSGAIVTWVYEYDMCRHEVTEEAEANADLVGLSFSQLQQKYPQARIVLFEPDAVTLEMSFTCYCPSHYILKKDGDELGLFRTRAGTDEQEKIQEYHIKFDSISAGERDAVSVGREFSDMTDVGVYIQKLLRNSGS
jgi:hypothetical protein